MTKEIKLGIKCSKWINGDLEYLEGYIFNSNERTKEQFENQRNHDTMSQEDGNICLDLMDMDSLDIFETITVSEHRYDELRA